MRLSTQALLIILASSGEETAAFAPSSLLQARRQHHNAVDHSHKVLQAMSDLPDDSPAPVKKKVLTAADVMAKSKSLGTTGGSDPSAPGEQEVPKLFSPEIYDDFQSALLTLEKRTKEGPGSLSGEEVAMLEEETVRIVKEMKEFMEDPKGMGAKIRKGYEGESTDAVVEAKVETVEAVVDEPKSTPPPPVAAAPPVTASAAPATADGTPAINTIPSEDEPEIYTDDSMNNGLAKGTTNTYIIPGMDEMSAEEYRDKLQETISARQAQRRALATSNNKGAIGNASSQGYLEALAPGGGSGFPGGGKAVVEAKVEAVEAVVEEPKSSPSVSLRSLVQQPPPPPVAAAPPVTASAATATADGTPAINTIPSEDEPEIYTDDSMNNGLAKGTTNTYLIPGMDEMSAEEYRDKLQETISARQAQRRAISLKNNQGLIGNANSQGYLDALAGGGGTGGPGGGSGNGMKPKWNPKGEINTSFDNVSSKQKSFGKPKWNKKSRLSSVKGVFGMEDGGSSDDVDSLDADVPVQHKEEQSGVENALADENNSLKMPLNKKSRLSSVKGIFGLEDGGSSDDAVENGAVAADNSEEVSSKSEQDQTADLDNPDEDEEESEQGEDQVEAELEIRQTDTVDDGSTDEDENSSKSEIKSKKQSKDDQEEEPASVEEPLKEEPAVSPMMVLKKKKLVQEQSRQSEWLQEGEGEPKSRVNKDKSQSNKVKTVGRYKRMQTDQEMQKAALDDKTLPTSPASPLSALAKDDWWGDKRPTQRPKPASERKSKFFGVHTALSTTDVERGFEASQKVSSESTQNFAHGNVDSRPTTTAKKEEGYMGKKFDVHSAGGIRTSMHTQKAEKRRIDHRDPGDVRSPGKAQVRLQKIMTDHRSSGDVRTTEAKKYVAPKSLVGIEVRQRPNTASTVEEAPKSLVESEIRLRPVASSDAPEYATPSDHRAVGDTRVDPHWSAQKQPPKKSLVESEGPRIRPVASSKLPEYAAMDHRGVGDRRKSSPRENAPIKSLAETETRVRPAPSTNAPEYSELKDHRSVGDTRMTKSNRETPASLVQTEERVRPVPTSNAPDYAQVRDHRDPGDGAALTRRDKSTSASAKVSLIESEERVRPAAKNHPHGYGKAMDHRGPGDTRREKTKESPAAQSLIENEGSIRPAVSSSKNYPHGYGSSMDHRGPGDTRREKTKESPAAQSLIENEGSIRPVVSSSANIRHGFGKDGADHRGPGDSHALTRREQSKSAPSSMQSLVDNEYRSRPVPSSNHFQNLQVGDHRGVGDTRTLTSKVQATTDTSSLSQDEQRQRPSPSSGGTERVSDFRGPGDNRTITKKIGDQSFPKSRVTASLSNDEQRLRPIPPAHHRASSPATSDDGLGDAPKQEGSAQWWNEQTQRRTTTSSTPSENQAKPLDRSMDDTLKEKESHAGEDSSSTLPDESSHSSSFALKSLLKDKKERWLTSVRAKMSPSNNKTPIAEIQPSRMQSLLRQDEEPSKGKMNSHNSERKGSQLSSLLKDDQAKRGASPTYENSSWWTDTSQRPSGYVKHNQSLKTIEVKKNEAPLDYGNVVEAQSDDDNTNDQTAVPEKDHEKEKS